MCVTVKWESKTELTLVASCLRRAIPSLESHEDHVCSQWSSDTVRRWRVTVRECLTRRAKKKKSPFVTDHFTPCWICIARKEAVSVQFVCFYFFFSVLVCFWNLGALCKVRCLSVYGLTTVGLWTEMEGNPELFDPCSPAPSTAE